MPEVFSVYNCGTSHNRQNLDETVADLARRSAGAENRDWMLNDGPGSYPHNADKSARALDQSLAAQAKTPGTRDPITGLKEASAFAVIRGAVSGYGWEHNVDHTMAVLNATRDLPHTINVAGWSRGAITCFMIAHALYENPRTTTIAVNIFALDPVPGPGNFDDQEKVTLPANVRNYAAIMQQDERRKIFKPVQIDEDIPPGIKNRFYYMPGGHSTGVFRSRNEIGLIATFLVHRFLQKHGTRLNNPIQLATRDLCELYAKVRLDTAQYERSGGGALLLLGKQRRTLPNRFQDTGYFINDHHANQFRKMFPLVWSALEHGVAATGRPAFESALAALRIIAPTTYLSLEKVGILS
jgi:hypothetical protein